MKWLIIGTGWISELFIQSLRNENEDIIGVYSRTETKGLEFAKKNKIKNVITTLKDLSEYDAVYIGTPNTIHFDQAKKVIESGKHVMIEKPMTHSYDLTKELYKLAEDKSVKIMEAYAHITNDIYKTFKGKSVKTNFMQLSSKIKNGTYKKASSFNKDLFGGVIPDLGVYAVSSAVMILGNVNSTKIKINKELNDVIVDCEIKLTHEKGESEFRISKVEDGDNSLIVDGEKVLDHLSLSSMSGNRMDAEINKFVNGNNLDFYKNISIETARVVEELLKK